MFCHSSASEDVVGRLSSELTLVWLQNCCQLKQLHTSGLAECLVSYHQLSEHILGRKYKPRLYTHSPRAMALTKLMRRRKMKKIDVEENLSRGKTPQQSLKPPWSQKEPMKPRLILPVGEVVQHQLVHLGGSRDKFWRSIWQNCGACQTAVCGVR